MDLVSKSIQGLGWKNPDVVILTCVDLTRAKELMKEFHQVLCGGDHADSTIPHKILRS